MTEFEMARIVALYYWTGTSITEGALAWIDLCRLDEKERFNSSVGNQTVVANVDVKS